MKLSDRERQIPRGVSRTWNVKCDAKELRREAEIDSQTREGNAQLPTGKERRDKCTEWDGRGRATVKHADPRVGRTWARYSKPR